MKTLLAALPLAFVFACSAAPSTPTGTSNPAAANDGTDPDAGAAADPDAGPAAPTCAPPPEKSACGNDSSWVRGVAHFDPSHYAAGAKPVLRLALRHGFALIAGEEKIGGRLHAFTSVNVDPAKGEVAFAIDMCGLGAAMWSEENGAFNLVFIMDENANNNLDNANSNQEAIAMGTPDANELQQIVNVNISCHAESACLDVQIDCTGTSCLAITPIKSCTKKTPSCKSDSAYCK